MEHKQVIYKQKNINKILEFEKLKEELKKIQGELDKTKKENLHQKNIIGILFSRGNAGEHDERILKTLIVQDPINSKKIFDNYDEINKIELLDHNDNVITSCNEIKKASSNSKADIIIKVTKKDSSSKIYNISVKSFRRSEPSLFNHTQRSANIFQNVLKDDLTHLDEMVKFYFKVFSVEDVRLSEILEEKKKLNEKDTDKLISSLIKLLEYCLFSGSGSKESLIKANSIILIKDNPSDFSNIKFFDCCDKEKKKKFISEHIIPNVKFSIRSKSGININKHKKINEIWAKESNKSKLLFHLRLLKSVI